MKTYIITIGALSYSEQHACVQDALTIAMHRYPGACGIQVRAGQ